MNKRSIAAHSSVVSVISLTIRAHMVSEPQGQQENEEGNKRMDRHMGWLLCVVLACRVVLVDETRSNGPKVWVSDQLTVSESWTERGGYDNGVLGAQWC